jgi:Zn finger protein HypA/HybF involved in hydrogenase expression
VSAKNPVQRFQDEMKKLGLGVSIQFNDREPVLLTSWCCPDCNGKRDVSTENKTGVPCPDCGSEKAAVLV